MTPGEYPFQSVSGLVQAVTSGELSAVELTEATFARLERHDDPLHAFLYVDREGALAQAAMVDRARAAGETLGPLAGVPVAVKDNLCTRGVPTTCASRILEGYVPPYDAHVVERLREAGAVIVGKTNLDEFAMGSSNEHSAFGPTRNPWDHDRVPGGSSGGSAAATGAGIVPLALGSDTGGSVRQPAAFCGVTAIKPTYGRVSRYGLVAFASSLDQVGPIGGSVRDAARLLGVIAGHDPRDATSAATEVPEYEAHCGEDVTGLRVGVVQDMGEGSDPEVAAATEAAAKSLEKLGCELVPVKLPHARQAVSVYYLIAPSEASSNLARFDGIRYGLRVGGADLAETYDKTRQAGFGAEVKRRIMLGTYALSAGYYEAYYLRAQKVRTLLRQDYEAAFAECDVVLTPTTPTPAFRLGEKVTDPLQMYLADIFTLPPSLAGLPALGLPSGFTDGGLPVGLQLTAPAFEEGRLVRVGHAFEQEAGLIERRPSRYG
ncbi:MAG: Asp-tRNA(Asn)/Glu-tRNA(Gln) amidotransferase subunit GatA [Myxococcota bacterium]